MSYNCFFLSVLVVLSLFWFCHCAHHFDIMVASTSCSVWGRKYQSRNAFFLFSVQLGMHSLSHVLWNVCVFCTWILVWWCRYLSVCVHDPNDASLFYWAVSTGLVSVKRTHLLQILLRGHFSVSGQTIHIGTRIIQNTLDSLFSVCMCLNHTEMQVGMCKMLELKTCNTYQCFVTISLIKP